ncbi:MAG: ATP-binding protein [Proteobacteria bacterium]|nr:ATP-binding protein [Pseudomonadota bacterium]
MLKDNIKTILREFHESKPPEIIDRDLTIDPEFFHSTVNKICTIVGARRAGKTFFLLQIVAKLIQETCNIEDIIYINFEDERILPLTANDLQIILDAYFELYGENRQPYIFFDEIQNVDGWEQFTRRLNAQGYRLFVTGSNSKMLSREIASALRGRTITYELFPFSFSEFLFSRNIQLDNKIRYGKKRHAINSLFDEYLFSGGYPEIVLMQSETVRQRILQDYFNTIFYRDLVERYRIKNLNLLRLWMNTLMVNISTSVSFRKYENDFKSQGEKLSVATLANFSRYLEEVYFGFFVEMYSASERKRRMNPRKFYLIDPALHNYLTLRFSQNKGRLLENLVFLELRRSGKTIHYYKTKAGHEVDFVVSNENSQPTLIQVCYDLQEIATANREKRALQAAMRELNIQTGTILTNESKDRIDENGGIIEILPVREWLGRSKLS